MRFQQSWKDLDEEEITIENQQELEITYRNSIEFGFHHIETARHYGTSERQLGWAMQKYEDPKRLLQTKVPPNEDPKRFEAEIELSFRRLKCERLDLLAIHGINLPEHLEQTVRPGGCLDIVRRLQLEGRVRYVGFSTHGPTELIVQAIETNAFDYVNLHWYFIRQENTPALEAAERFDLGVFIISPTDKGGHLHSPSKKLLDLCSPFHPIVFNDLFCLRDNRIHTISVGAARPQDLNLHLEAIGLMDKAEEIVPMVEDRLWEEARSTLGGDWLDTWHEGLPSWDKTPGNINIPILLWLNNLIEAWGMESYAKARYALLGQGSHWFPGENANGLDRDISEITLKKSLHESPWCDHIPGVLRRLRDQFRGESQKRLSKF